MCPASGTCPTAACNLKPVSLRKVGVARVPLGPAVVAMPVKPKACRQQAVTVSDDAFPKFRQELRYQTPEWRAMYGSPRNTIEGFNGTVKDGNGMALEIPSRRRVRGIAAQWLLVLFMLLGENVRRIRSWKQRAEAADGGEVRKASRARRRDADLAEWKVERARRVDAGLPVFPVPKTRSQKKRAKARDARARPSPPGEVSVEG